MANDTIGYIPDRQAYALGGYPIWTGYHSNVAPGTAEAIADETVKVLHEVGCGYYRQSKSMWVH